MKVKFGCYESFLQKKKAEFLREREIGGTDFVSTPMGAHSMIFLKYDIRKLMKGKFDCYEPLLQKIAEFLRERGTFS